MRAAREPLIARLLAEPQRFEFVQAVRLLLLWLGEQGVPPERALARHLRFPNSVSLGFPASEIEALARITPSAGALPQFFLTPGFMGLLGGQGALPLHVTEGILARQAHAHAHATHDPADLTGPDERDPSGAARAFLDMFSTRMLALFYGAWRKYRVEHAAAGAPGAPDAYLPLLLALAGLPGGLHDGVGPEAIARYAGVLRRRPASAAVLARVLSDHFGVAVAILEGVGHWDPLAPHEQTRLGIAPPARPMTQGLLGESAVLGARCWRPDLRVRVRIGPLTRRQFERFLPDGSAARALRTMLGLFAVPTLSYEIVLVLRRDAVRPIRLDEGSRRLGVDGYLVTAPSTADRADMRYEIRPMAPLPPLLPSTASRENP